VRELSAAQTKWLKIAHLVSVIMMLGGIMCGLVINKQLQSTGYANASAMYAIIGTISDQIVRYGAQGTLLTALIYSVWTNWALPNTNGHW
jgi:Na+/phosphate symporter